ncbi:TIGR04219 family outer membrane beta-barrel protein [Cellvibrio mixtus]|uniref:TIGR04219 family outer membrane beta-barrel protein n=1 Tax=Cellvibrio mixtus TaxID=39650 RepID=UPI000587485E|nr:TIGR04219 family outer membrane beta-barrel protein [Cellvibrio mixtus]
MRHITQTGKISFVALTLAFCQHASADTVFGIYAGAGSWQSEYSGSAGDPKVSADDLGMKDNNNNFYYIAIEHPVPFLPNLKVQQNNITSDQTGTINNNFSIDNVVFPAGTSVKTDFDLSSTDASLYYEFLDNWLNLDLGITLRKYSGHLKAEALTLRDEIDVDATVPLIYGKFQFDLPLTGFSAGIEGNFISYDGNNLHDYNAKISYMFDSALDLGLEVGYRTMKIDINEDDVTTNLELKGPYAAAVFHF